MKISKTALLTLSGVFSIAGLGLMLVSAKELDLVIDPSNAVQHIESVKFIVSGSVNPTATLSQVGDRLVGIDTDDFALSEMGEYKNTNNDNLGSTILGGIKNELNGGSYNVILGGEGNNIEQGLDNVILGGNGNRIEGGKNFSAILGGKSNRVSSSIASVIVGGSENLIEKNDVNDGYSVVVGSHSSVKGSLSAALGVNSHVNGSKSFLWTDGENWTQLDDGNAFAVVGKSGMVVGTNEAHSFAKLTLNGGLVVRKGASTLECNHQNGGTLKVVDAPGGDGRICLCSCDGDIWSSMFGLGQCRSACDNKYNPPECDVEVYRNCSGSMNVYSGTCKNGRGEVLEGVGAYLVDKDNVVHWSCQTDDGLVVNCSAEGTNIKVNDCDYHGMPHECKGDYPPTGEGYLLGAGSYLLGHTPSRWKKVDDTKDELGACEWRCNRENGYERSGGNCVLQTLGCSGNPTPGTPGYKFGASTYTYGYLPGTWTYTGSSTLNPCQYTCDTNYTWNSTSKKCELNACHGTLPTNAILWNSTAIPSNNSTNYEYSASSTTAACKFKCDTNYTWNSTSKKCELNACQGTLPTNAILWNSTAIPSNNSTNYEYSASSTTAACKFKCNVNYTWNSTSKECKLNACQGTLPTNATLNSNTVPSNNATNYFCDATSTAACAYTCPNGYKCNSSKNGCDKVTYSCQGTKPTNATLNSNTAPSNNTTSYFCDATSTAACAYTCPSGYKCNSSKNGCDKVTYSCQGTLPSHASLWNSNTPSNNTTYYVYSASSTSTACRFKCDTNYTWKTTTSTCELNACQGTKPTNATLNSNTAPSNNTTSYFCDATSTAACAYTCPSGYKCNSSKNGCDKVTYSCQGTKPANTTLWNSNTPSNNTTYYEYSASSTTAACKFKCNTNYTWNSTSKECKSNACQGTLPTNATLNSNTTPSNNTTSYFCDATSEAACAYTCPSGYKCNSSKNGCDKVTYSCQGTLPDNATLWNSNTPSNNTTYYVYSASSTSTACRFKCNTNYTWKVTTSTCELNVCQGTKPANTTLWNPSAIPSNNSTDYEYSASSTTAACKFKCDTNYTWNSTSKECKLNACQGTKPANTTLWSPSAIPSNNSTNYEYSATSTTAACKFKCDTNYTWNSTSKECKLNACQGTKPANTTLWSPSAIPSNNSTNYEYSASSTTAACKFKCDTNYTWDSTSKECKLNACQGTLPDHATLWNSSAIPSNNSTNYEYSSSSTTAACKFKCIAEGVQYRWNSTEKKCEPISHVCQGTLPNHASLWNSTAPSNDTTYYVYSASSTTTACRFKCDANYTWKVTTSTCELNVCQGTLPNHATLWNSSAIPSNNSTDYEYSASSTTAACKFKCDTNYTWNSTSKECKLNVCQGTLPDHATLWNSTAIPSNNSTNYEYSASSTTAACKFKCDTNYTWNSTSKECKLNTCQGTLPDNASLWNSSAIPSNNSTNYEYSATSTTAACKFKCDTDYTWNSTSKKCELKRTVTYDYRTNGGTSSTKTSDTLVCRSSVDLTPVATKNGWEFIGWNTDKNATSKLNSQSMPCDSNLTLYAIYKKTCTVTFKPNGNQIKVGQTEYAYTSSDYSRSVTIYNTATTYSFTAKVIKGPTDTATVIGWSTAADRHENDWYPNKTKDLCDATYYAQTKETKSPTIKFKKDSDTVASIGNNQSEIEQTLCTVTKYNNGSWTPSTCEITVPACSPKTCYEKCYFYNGSSSSNGLIPGSKYSFNASINDTEYTARATIKKFTVIYNPAGGKWSDGTTTNKTSSSVSCGNITLEGKPSKDSCSFLGWRSSSDGGLYAEKTSYSLTENTTMTAEWDCSNTFKVTFKANCNEIYDAENDQYTTNDLVLECSTQLSLCYVQVPAIKKPSDGNPIGYTLSSSYSESDSLVSPSVMFPLSSSNNGRTYYAHANHKKTYEMDLAKDNTSVDSIGANSASCNVIKYDCSSWPTSCDMTFPSCTAKECYKDCKFGTYSPNSTQSVSLSNWSNGSNPKFTATATIKKFTVTYNPAGGKWSNGTTTNKVFNNVSCGNITLESAPDKDYNDFQGWKSSIDDLSYVAGATYSLKSDVTMTAQWKEKSYSCGATHWLCGGLETATNQNSSNSTKWTWDCGTKSCYECKDGYTDEGNGVCKSTSVTVVGPQANVKNNISANPMRVVAYINGNLYSGSVSFGKGQLDTTVFSTKEGPDKVEPGDNYSITIMPVYEDGSIGSKCNLEPSGVQNRIDEIGWMGGSKVGLTPREQGYVRYCEDERPRCAFDGTYCSRGTKVGGYTNSNNGNVRVGWTCKGLGAYSSESKDCELEWNCDASCSYDGSAGCTTNGGAIYEGLSFGSLSEMACKSVGYKVKYGIYGEQNGLEPCRLNSTTLPYPYNTDLCSGTYGGCAKWTANLSCTIKDSGTSSTYYNDQAISKCGASGISSPSCKSSSAAGPFGGGGSSSDNGCHIKSNSAYPDGCKAAYHGGSMAGETNAVVNNNGVWNISDATNPAGLTSYCKGQTTKSACEAVGVARHQPQSYTVRYWGVTLPYTNTNFSVETAACCEWGG